MKLLFKRGQARSLFNKPIFTLMAKSKFDDEEMLLARKYDFMESILIPVEQLNLMRNAYLVGIATFFIATPLVGTFFWRTIGLGWVGVICICALLGIAAGFVFYHSFRETIYVKDLVYGHNFKCRSIVELARKEAWLRGVTAYLCQIMEAAKTWGGQEIVDIPTLDGQDAIRMIQGKL